jgi:hypothetical protein
MDTGRLSEAGDSIKVVAKKGNLSNTSYFVVAGGRCACHISKVSGAKVVVLK